MNRSKIAKRAAGARRRLAARLVGVGASAAAFAASATPTNDWPADLASAVTYIEGKGTIALAVCVVLTLITLGIKGSKLPRRG